MKKFATLVLIAASMILVLGAGHAFAGRDADPAKLKVALLPDEDASTVIKQNKGFKNYLEIQLEKEIELIVTTDYSSMIEAMRHGRIDLAYFGPLSYVLAKSRSEIEAFAAKTKNGKASYHAVVIANAQSGITSLSDIKGHNMAFGDQASTSSHMIPKSMLVDAGLQPGTDYNEHFLGAHDAVAISVQRGTAQAGGLSQPIFQSLVAKGLIDKDKVRVLAVSDPFPQYPWAMRSDLDSGLKERIRSAFYSLADKDILKVLKADGMAPISDADYNVVRNMQKSLGM